MTTTEQIIAVATGLGWQASTTKYENRVVFDFQQYTPKGQDFNVSVEMKDGDFDRFLCELENFYEGFDPDYETYLWIGNDGHGKNGAPYHIKDIVTDMEEAEKMIETLYETLKKAIAENENTLHKRCGKDRNKPLSKFPQDRKHHRNERTVLWQKRPFGTLWQLHLQCIERTRNLL